MSERIGFIGLGVMGRPMARNLLARGFSVVVHSRSRGPVDELVAAGAQAATTPADVARQSAIVVTMVPDSPDVEAVLEGADGVFTALAPGSLIVDCSTIAPAVARRLAARAAELGSAMIDAPVSGGEVGAKSASLSIMIGGDAPAVERARAGARGDGQQRTHRAHRSFGIGSAVQGLQPDGDRRHARRGQRSVRARAQGGRRSGTRSDGSARRLRQQPCARRARRADSELELRARISHATLREGSWHRRGYARGISDARAGRGRRPAARDGTRGGRPRRDATIRRSRPCCSILPASTAESFSQEFRSSGGPIDLESQPTPDLLVSCSS